MTKEYELEKLAKQQEYALQLEETKWKYKQKELAYVEAGNHMRALNQLMWQVPSIAMAITGGLWYGAANLQVAEPRAWVFAFAIVADVMTIITLHRLRKLIQRELEKQATFESISLPKSKNIVVWCWTIVLFSAATTGFFGALNSDKFNARPNPTVIQLVTDKQQQTAEKAQRRPQASEPALHSSRPTGTKKDNATSSPPTSSPVVRKSP
ncbi:hypothetical protein KIF53_01390 [Chromobacterium subtsugae]|uniref:DUF4231 domain-containing protein n=1 Tax=Chromobacterium subtsugae TaxID=251747 RepID=A0ABS7F872_9NEIS|nr:MULTISPECIES: hypothetical protein [Chromobacterium]MBW7565182.1 hypothetical protein [Chromobacterium subtsugae]MBW8286290.1 hypothetical protein [Chromobacterium subtsugae]WSE91662.1 hypothetical protein U6115_00055 [Chromobacterium subtsugae]WVH60037.1 hypothetical protein U6151_00055 [Chromobacterium subtsugae]